MWSVLQTISLCKVVFQPPLHFLYLSFNAHPTYQLRIFSMNSILISAKNQRRFFTLVETTAISPAMIKLLTRARVSYLLFQNQLVNDEEDKSAGILIVYG